MILLPAKSFFRNICYIVTLPFRIDFIGFCLFCILFSGVPILYHYSDLPTYGVYIAVYSFLQCYVILFVLTLNQKVYRIIKLPIFIFLTLYFSLNLLCYYRIGCIISPEILSSVLATNRKEATEFLITYVKSFDYCLFSFIILLSSIVFYLSVKRQIILHYYAQILLTCILFVSTISIARNHRVISFYWEALYNLKLDEVVDLSQHLSYPTFDFEPAELPEKIIIILGESFTPVHSSLYGYPIQTNPHLASLKQDSSLYVYTQVNSPASYTVTAFKYILNTHLISDPDSVSWYESLTAVELFHQLGYSTYWLSNQRKSGMHDNVASTFAMICDSSLFVTEKIDNPTYDEHLLGPFIPKEGKQAVFYHLMGQHGAFESRYPSSFSQFSDSLYLSFPQHQRHARKTYDTATLYNDYVVSEIFSQYASADVIAFYFPDHGLDFYDVDDEFYGHGRLANLASVTASRKIPFFCYLSQPCRSLHPELLARIIDSQDLPLCTDAFTYYLMQMLNIRLAHNQ